MQAYQISRDSNPKGPLRRENVRWTLEQQRLQTCEACAGGRMHSIRKSPSWRANKIVLRQKSYFYCKHIKSAGTRTRKGCCIRENVQWTFEQQRLQTCVACAGGRMHSIRKSPSWRANKIVLRQKSYFYCKHIKSAGTRTRKGCCIRENVQWTFEQQRLQTCVACAEGRMRSIRESPSWRAKSKTLIER